MLQFLESPIIMWLIIAFFFLFFFVLFHTALPKAPGRHQTNINTLMKLTKEDLSECTVIGLLEKLPKGDPIPKECLNCQRLVECSMAKKAFDWYLGKHSAQNSEDARVPIRSHAE